MNHHECKPPMENRPVSDSTWTCPDCRDVWEAHPLGPLSPAEAYVFLPEGGGYGVTSAFWVRLGPTDRAS